MAALASVSGLAKSLRAQAASGDSTQSSLGGYDDVRTRQLVQDTFGTPQQLPPGVEMVRHTFVIGGGKGCRQKFDKDLPKTITASLRDIGFQEDKSADTSASSAGTFKRQHDTGANLIYCHVFPRVIANAEAAGEETDDNNNNVMGLGDMMSRPLNLCVHSEMGTFRQMIEIEVKAWSQKKNLLTELNKLIGKHEAITQKMINREELSSSEHRLFELDVDGLVEKTTWLKKIMKQQVGKKLLTRHDLSRLVQQVDDKLGAAAIAEKAKEKLLARKEMLLSTNPQPDNFKGKDELLRLYAKLFDIKNSISNAATVKQLTAIKGVEDLIGPLEQASGGWFEEDELVQQRLKKLQEQAKTIKPAEKKKKSVTTRASGSSRQARASNGGWSTVTKKKSGNRFAAFN